MKRVFFLIMVLSLIIPIALFAQAANKDAPPQLSSQTSACIGCHKIYTPGIVEDWMRSLHSKTSPSIALKKEVIERRLSAEKFDAGLANVAVGCYECHSLNPSNHKDNFSHFGYKINTVVSLADCSTCHPVEATQYSVSKKAHAVGNLTKKPCLS